jgi:hypothetical protein
MFRLFLVISTVLRFEEIILVSSDVFVAMRQTLSEECTLNLFTEVIKQDVPW